MSSEGLHVPREKLSKKTLNMHYAISSLIEELEAVDWYRQRADDCDDPEPWRSSGSDATTISSPSSSRRSSSRRGRSPTMKKTRARRAVFSAA